MIQWHCLLGLPGTAGQVQSFREGWVDSLGKAPWCGIALGNGSDTSEGPSKKRLLEGGESALFGIKK